MNKTQLNEVIDSTLRPGESLTIYKTTKMWRIDRSCTNPMNHVAIGCRCDTISMGRSPIEALENLMKYVKEF